MAQFEKFKSHEKINKAQVLEAMKNGAILTKRHGIYSYWDLTYTDGTRHFNIRKDATNSIRSEKNVEVVIIANGVTYKYKN